MQSQTQTNWCWAAVSASVSDFFGGGGTWTQCAVANATWSRTDCCGDGADGPCNQSSYLDQALELTGNFASMVGTSETFAVVQGEIAASRPLCIRVSWNLTDGHFLAIYGWLIAGRGTKYYLVADPIYGTSQITETALRSAYQGIGSWSHSYHVAPPSAAGGGVTVMASRSIDPTSIGG
jgi:hypothetical protein